MGAIQGVGSTFAVMMYVEAETWCLLGLSNGLRRPEESSKDVMVAKQIVMGRTRSTGFIVMIDQ